MLSDTDLALLHDACFKHAHDMDAYGNDDGGKWRRYAASLRRMGEAAHNAKSRLVPVNWEAGKILEPERTTSRTTRITIVVVSTPPDDALGSETPIATRAGAIDKAAEMVRETLQHDLPHGCWHSVLFAVKQE